MAADDAYTTAKVLVDSGVDAAAAFVRSVARKAWYLRTQHPNFFGSTEAHVVEETDLDGCNNAYTISDKVLGSGLFATTHAACQGAECSLGQASLVVKVLELEPLRLPSRFQNIPARVLRGMFDAELAIMTMAASIGAGPEVKASWLCSGRAFIAMEHLHPVKEWTLNDVLGVARHLTRMADHGLMHNDVHNENVMKNDKGDVRLIDYGMSTPITASPQFASVRKKAATLQHGPFSDRMKLAAVEEQIGQLSDWVKQVPLADQALRWAITRRARWAVDQMTDAARLDAADTMLESLGAPRPAT